MPDRFHPRAGRPATAQAHLLRIGGTQTMTTDAVGGSLARAGVF